MVTFEFKYSLRRIRAGTNNLPTLGFIHTGCGERQAEIPRRNIFRLFYSSYSQLANGRGGRLLIFRNFSDSPGAYQDPPLIDFQEKF